ncbi:MAG: mandelate racemase/muconate lactonizing enzyme family protein [Anaerolineae bacterium]|nr:mandelate racemase/muconate lactonizing enzyme family protein [Thermoflexales bacterium]MDW8406606.1 mandelate racemase/muconate lactonizing enzyme family protein [Anaerolineae bacterium]
MKITDIKVYPVWVGSRNQCIVKVETDEGLYGWGESGLSGRELAVQGAIRHYREFLIGRDAMQRGALWQEMYRSQYFEGGRVLVAAISAIDIALYDIAGKALGVPVYQLLGGKQRDWVPCFATTGAPMGPQLIEDVKLLLAHGWNVIRTVPGHPAGDDPNVFEPRESIGLTAKWLTKLREAVGPEPVLGIDYHHRLSVAEAASFCQRMPSGTLDFLEEPIRDETPEAYEVLRTMTDVPLAIGEEFSSKWQFLPYIERGITNFARIDICNVGGFTEAMKVAGWAEAHYIDLMPHNPLGPVCTAATVHLAAAVANFAWMEVRVSPTENLGFDDSEWFPVQLKLEGNRFRVPDGPGLGVEFNEALAHQHTLKFWEPPHLRRRDGSYTNW